jgi:hypothetical protein
VRSDRIAHHPFNLCAFSAQSMGSRDKSAHQAFSTSERLEIHEILPNPCSTISRPQFNKFVNKLLLLDCLPVQTADRPNPTLRKTQGRLGKVGIWQSQPSAIPTERFADY